MILGFAQDNRIGGYCRFNPVRLYAFFEIEIGIEIESGTGSTIFDYDFDPDFDDAAIRRFRPDRSVSWGSRKGA
mgnify:CR=1 FL=1